jgi:membrane-associated phospholipid phosphatase
MSQRSFVRWARRHPDGGLGLRLALSCLAVVLVAGPFAVLLALVDARWAPLRHLDDSTTHDTHAFVEDHPGLVTPLRATAYVLHPLVFRTVVVAMAVWLAVRGARRLAAWALVTIAVAGVLEAAVKSLVGRARPVVPAPVAHAPGASFPSGHALTATVGSAVIVLLLTPFLGRAGRVAAWTAAVVVSVASGAFRVLLGVHYLSDVTAGWVLGAAIVLATAAAFATWRHGEGRAATDGRAPTEVP